MLYYKKTFIDANSEQTKHWFLFLYINTFLFLNRRRKRKRKKKQVAHL